MLLYLPSSIKFTAFRASNTPVGIINNIMPAGAVTKDALFLDYRGYTLTRFTLLPSSSSLVFSFNKQVHHATN